MLCVPYFSVTLLNTKATRNPTTVIRPAKLWAFSHASEIIVSASMASMAPAATAVVGRYDVGQELAAEGITEKDSDAADDYDPCPHAKDINRVSCCHPEQQSQAGNETPYACHDP
jgi:hypothetical protein